MKTILALVAAGAIVAGSFFVFQEEKTQETTLIPVVTIYRTDDGFSPMRANIKLGDSVAFVNSAASEVWPASDSHPLHDVYPEFDSKRPLQPGETWIFTFDRVGDWAFHDHLRSNKTGVVSVTP